MDQQIGQEVILMEEKMADKGDTDLGSVTNVSLGFF